MVAEGIALVARGTDVFAMRVDGPDEAQEETDARVLPVAPDQERGRHLDWSAGARQLAETSLDQCRQRKDRPDAYTGRAT